MSLTVVLFGLIVISAKVLAGAEEFLCSEKGRFIDETDADCSRYFLCSQKKNGEWVKTTYDCPEATNFDIDLGYCTTDAECAFVTTTTIPSTTTGQTETTTTKSNSNYTCIEEGRFPDGSACDCGWFYECSLVNAQFYSLRLYCPPSTKFNPSISACSSEYECVQEFVCTQEGLFPNKVDGTKYYSCTEMQDGSFLQESHACLPYSIFVETMSMCVETTTTTIVSDTSTLSTTELVETTTGGDFRCDGIGRFRDPDDDLCKWYYLCANNQSTHYSCPRNMYFDPVVQECSAEYKCDSTTSWSTESWIAQFHCKKRGYFKNDEDTSCQQYHFCDILGDGKIYQYDLICPDQYIFDANTNVCSSEIECN